MKKLVFVLSFILAQYAFAANDCGTIKVNHSDDDNGRYAMIMLKLALSKIEHDCVIEEDPNEVSQARAIENTMTGAITLLWAATDANLEEKLLPVRIPLYKGLLGHRVFIINPQNQWKFDQVKTFDDLKKLTFGQGSTWADKAILESNGLTVKGAPRYQNLFYMVDGGRFDAFPRGINEPWGELAQRKTPEIVDGQTRPDLSGLTVEKRLMLVYKMPFYFFVSKQKPLIAKLIEDGLEKAIADGSFDEVFYNDPMVKGALEKANVGDRIGFEINNPNLTDGTKAILDREELWFDIREYAKKQKENQQVSMTSPSPQDWCGNSWKKSEKASYKEAFLFFIFSYNALKYS